MACGRRAEAVTARMGKARGDAGGNTVAFCDGRGVMFEVLDTCLWSWIGVSRCIVPAL